jgi:hypothetical protein
MARKKIPDKIRVEIFKRDNHRCVWCGRGAPDNVILEIDHVTPVSEGGENEPYNLATLCLSCNRGKGGDYYGNYLVKTWFNVPDLDARISLSEPNIQIHPPEMQYLLRFRKQHEAHKDYYELEQIAHSFTIPFTLIGSKDPSMQMRFGLILEENKLIFKEKIKEYLFQNKGFFKLVSFENNTFLVFRLK